MKMRSQFTVWEVGKNGLSFNVVVESKKTWEVVSKYNAVKPLKEMIDENGNRYVEIPLENENTATYNLEEFQIRTLMFCPVF